MSKNLPGEKEKEELQDVKKGGVREKFSMIDLLFVKRTLEGKEEGKTGVKAPGRLIKNLHFIYTDSLPPVFPGTMLGCVWRRIKASRQQQNWQYSQ